MAKIAAIMPTFNQVRYITQAIDSVLPLVDRLIIVDDGSNDGTREYLEGIQCGEWDLVCMDKNGGTAEAINAGYSILEEEEWVTWVSSDNVTQHTWREWIEEWLHVEDIGVVYTGFIRCNPQLKPMQSIFHPHEPEKLISTENCYYGPSFVIARRVWDAVGGHRGRISHDYDHWLRVEEECWRQGLRIKDVNEPGVLYRVHKERVTVTRRAEYDAPRWQQEALQRRRQA